MQPMAAPAPAPMQAPTSALSQEWAKIFKDPAAWGPGWSKPSGDAKPVAAAASSPTAPAALTATTSLLSPACASPGKLDVLAYWDTRGLVAPIRMLYHYQGVAFEDKTYTINLKDDGSLDLSDWLTAKEKLSKVNPLINLPYLIVGDPDLSDGRGGTAFGTNTLVVSQSGSISSYLARRFGAQGCTEEMAATTDQIVDHLNDMRDAYHQLIYYTKDFEADKATFFAAGGAFEKCFGAYERWFGIHKKAFLVEDDHPTHADFALWEFIDVFSAMKKGSFDKYPALVAFHKRIRALPQLKVSARCVMVVGDVPSRVHHGGVVCCPCPCTCSMCVSLYLRRVSPAILTLPTPTADAHPLPPSLPPSLPSTTRPSRPPTTRTPIPASEFLPPSLLHRAVPPHRRRTSTAHPSSSPSTTCPASGAAESAPLEQS